MLGWLKSWWSKSRKCGLCKESYESSRPDIIHLKNDDGSFEEVEICTLCASQLELIKMKNAQAPYNISYD